MGRTITVGITPDLQWAFPEQKRRGRAFSSATPVGAMAAYIASRLGVDARGGFRLRVEAENAKREYAEAAERGLDRKALDVLEGLKRGVSEPKAAET